MTDQTRTDASTLYAIIADNEDWLVDRVLSYAKRQGFTRYTSTLRGAWRQSIAGLSAPLLDTLQKGMPDVELIPDEDYAADPLARFGIIEAKRHRQRGVDLVMFLAMMKYYRQSYMDLVDQESVDSDTRQRFSIILKRFFDRIEIGLVTTWHAPQQENPMEDLRRANRTITNEKNKYLTIFESLQCPVAVFHGDGRLDTVNHAWAFLFEGSQLPGSHYYDAPGKGPAVEWLTDEIDDFTASDETERTIEKAAPTNRGERLFSIRIKRMLDVSEKFSGTVFMLDDITQQKQTEEALQETTIWLTQMFNALEEAVFIETPNGRIVDANRAARQLFGYAIDELKGHTTKILHVDHDHYNNFTAQVRAALALNDTATFKHPARRKNGDVFPAAICITLLKKADQTPLGIVSTLRDISSQQQAEEAARDSERFQGALELAGAVCHDMNQPLMAINGYAELLLMDSPDDSAIADKLKKISRQVAKMGEITQKLMRVTRYKTKMYMDQQIIDIDKSSEK